MKKIISLLIILSLLVMPCYAGQHRNGGWGQTKPPAGSIIDWSNPLSRGLVGAWLMNEGGGKINNLVSPMPPTAVSTWVKTPKGVGIAATTTTAFSKQVITSTGDFTIVIFANPSTSVAYDSMFIQRTSYPNPQIQFTPNNDGNTLQSGCIGFYIGTDISHANLVRVASMVDGNYHQFALSRQGALVSVYRDGIQVYSQSLTLYSFNYASNTLSLGGFSNGGNIVYCYPYNRALSPSEIQSLYANPYQFIKYPTPFQHFIHAVTGAVTSQISKINGVALSSIAKVNGVAIGGISKVMGVMK